MALLSKASRSREILVFIVCSDRKRKKNRMALLSKASNVVQESNKNHHQYLKHHPSAHLCMHRPGCHSFAPCTQSQRMMMSKRRRRWRDRRPDRRTQILAGVLTRALDHLPPRRRARRRHGRRSHGRLAGWRADVSNCAADRARTGRARARCARFKTAFCRSGLTRAPRRTTGCWRPRT